TASMAHRDGVPGGCAWLYASRSLSETSLSNRIAFASGDSLHCLTVFGRRDNLPFLTLEDPNAKIKGSRDPLGVQPIWASFARHFISNLITQTNSVRGFTIFS